MTKATHTEGLLRSRTVSPDQLAGVSEIAELLGVPKRTAARYVDREDFPKPFDTLATGRVWLRVDVDTWAKSYLPLRPGRPPKAS